MKNKEISKEIEWKTKDIADLIYNSIQKTQENNIAISGKWGCGKTTILNEIEKIVLNNLENNNITNNKVIKIDLWIYELNDKNIFISILLDLLEQMNFFKADWKNILMNILLTFFKDIDKKNVSKILNFFGLGLLTTPYEITKFFISKCLKAKEDWNKSKKWSKVNKKYIEIYEEKLNIKLLIEFLNELFDKCKQKYYIFFDDLERCSEENIIKILTGVKNILFKTKSENVFFITAVNKEQINCVLKYKNEDYLEKIFTKVINLEKLTKYDEEIYDNSQKLNNCQKEILNIFSNNNFRQLNKYLVICNYFKNLDCFEKTWYLWLILLKENNLNVYEQFKNNVFNFSNKTQILKDLYLNSLEKLRNNDRYQYYRIIDIVNDFKKNIEDEKWGLYDFNFYDNENEKIKVCLIEKNQNNNYIWNNPSTFSIKNFIPFLKTENLELQIFNNKDSLNKKSLMFYVEYDIANYLDVFNEHFFTFFQVLKKITKENLSKKMFKLNLKEIFFNIEF